MDLKMELIENYTNVLKKSRYDLRVNYIKGLFFRLYGLDIEEFVPHEVLKKYYER